jgi:hypothetical protein
MDFAAGLFTFAVDVYCQLMVISARLVTHENIVIQVMEMYEFLMARV